MTKYLNKLKSPGDLKSLSEREKELLAAEIREFLIDKVSKTGGHLASNLGVVELSLALHSVFDSPKDKIIWDVGHQSYIHKIITGRAEKFETLRQLEGISGFPKREESIHDIYESGHSSTSVSVGLGMAKARDINNEDYSVVAVIGDGALTGGIAFEALNNAGHSTSNLIVILNDNEMSISQNIGGISRHLNRLRTASSYRKMKDKLKKAIYKIPKAGGSIFLTLEKMRDVIKYTLVDGIIFEELGFTYLGPVDGHNLHELIYVLNNSKNVSGPVLVHIHTKKGKGYINAEKEPDRFHGIGPFDSETGEVHTKSINKSYSHIFGEKLMQLAEENPKVVAITAAMEDGTGLKEFSKRYPDRFFDVGIAEQHAVSFATGLALNGMIPFLAIYSTFLQRSYDQIMMDVCLHNVPVIFCIDRAGIVGEDGKTHHGIFDISYMNHLPNLTVLAPKDKYELEAMLTFAVNLNKPCAIRYPRGSAMDLSQISNNYDDVNKLEILTKGEELCIFAVGRMVKAACEASQLLKEQNINITVINARVIKPLDEKAILEILKSHKKVIVIEDNTKIGGFGSSISALIHKNSLNDIHLYQMGWPDKFIEHGSIAELDRRYEMDEQGIMKNVLEMLNRRK